MIRRKGCDDALKTNHGTYYAVIPATIRYDKTLKDKAKLLYGEMTALCNSKGYCWASNSYFAELYGIAIETVSRLIKNLADSGYVKIEIVHQEDGKKIYERRIYLMDDSTKTLIPLDENVNAPLTETSIPLDENVNAPLTETSIPLDENVKDNNTINKTINKERAPATTNANFPNAKKIKNQPKTRGPYGWIKLTDDEYNRLISEFGENKINWTIEKIDESAEITGNRNEWKGWNLVIRKAIKNNWRFGESGQNLSNVTRLIEKSNVLETEVELEKRRQATGLGWR